MLRPFVRWYVAPAVDDQRDFNDIALKLLDAVDARVARATDARRLDELDERLVRLERARHSAVAAPPLDERDSARTPPSTPDGPMLDYFAFEARMRGSTDDIRSRRTSWFAC
jgi:hypothetical protein